MKVNTWPKLPFHVCQYHAKFCTSPNSCASPDACIGSLEMSLTIRDFFKPDVRLVHPQGSLLRSMPSKAIALTNVKVEKATNPKKLEDFITGERLISPSS